MAKLAGIGLSVLLLSVTGFLTDYASGQSEVTMEPGDVWTRVLVCGNPDSEPGNCWADAIGETASWISLQHIDFGLIPPGGEVEREYTVTVPENQQPGNYELYWTYGCTPDCSISDLVISVTIARECDVSISSEPKSVTVNAGEIAKFTIEISGEGACSGGHDVDVALKMTQGSQELRRNLGDWYFGWESTLKSINAFLPFSVPLQVKTSEITPDGSYPLSVIAEDNDGTQKTIDIDLIVKDTSDVGTIVRPEGEFQLYQKQDDGSWKEIYPSQEGMNAIYIEGKVLYKSPDGTFKQLTKGIPLVDGYELTTGVDGKLTVAVKGDPWVISENSQVKIQRNSESESTWELIKGKIKALITGEKLILERPVIQIITENGSIEPEGTEFIVEHNAQTRTTVVTLFEGKLKITPTKAETPEDVQYVDAGEIITLKDGKIVSISNLSDMDKQTKSPTQPLPIPSNAHEWNERGNALVDEGKYENALDAYDKALQLDPNDAIPWYNKALALLKLERYDETLAAANNAIDIDPNYADAWIVKGNALSDLERDDEAIAAYERAIAIDPNDKLALYNMGVTLYNQGNYEDAIVYYDKALAIDPNYVSAQVGKENAQNRLGGGCLIATATYGSELAPQVQMLRETRDNIVMKTQSGARFMTTFNVFYYSFSPTIADWERQNSLFKEIMKITITPLITTLSILQYVDIDSEAEMLGYGIGVILLNIGMYVVAPAIVITRLRSSKSHKIR